MTISVCISFPLLSMLTHNLSKAASFLCGSFSKSFFSIDSKAVRWANMAKSNESR